MKNYLILILLFFQLSAFAQTEVFMSTFTSIDKNYNFTEDNQLLFKNSYLIEPFDLSLKFENGIMLGVSIMAQRYDDFNLVWKKFNTQRKYSLENTNQPAIRNSRIIPQLNLQKTLVSDSFSAFFIGAAFGLCKNMVNVQDIHSSNQVEIDDTRVYDRYYGQIQTKYNFTPILDFKSGLFIFSKKTNPFYFKVESYLRLIFLSDVDFKQTRITTKNFPDPLEIDKNMNLPTQKVAGVGFSIGYKFNYK